VVEIPGELEEVLLCRLARRKAEMPVLLLVRVAGRRNHPGQWMVDFEVRMRLLEADGRCEESGRDGGGVAGGGRSVDVLAGSAGRR